MKQLMPLLCAALLTLCACAKNQTPPVLSPTDSAAAGETQTRVTTKNPLPDVDLTEREADVDLTALDIQMAYVQLSNMMLSPKEYTGKTVKLRGKFAHTAEENKEFFVCYLLDATACCSQSLEFETDGDYDFPDGYPPEQSDITVCGVFDTYEYNGYPMFRLLHAEVDYAV